MYDHGLVTTWRGSTPKRGALCLAVLYMAIYLSFELPLALPPVDPSGRVIRINHKLKQTVAV